MPRLRTNKFTKSKPGKRNVYLVTRPNGSTFSRHLTKTRAKEVATRKNKGAKPGKRYTVRIVTE